MFSIEYLRSFRIGGYAIFDLSFAFLGIYLLAPRLSKWLSKWWIIPKRNWLFLTLPLGIVIHLIVGNYTQMTKDFIDLNSHYLLKILILGLTLFGIMGIKKND